MKNNRGFTFVEILVTIVIISTALLGLVGLQAAGVRNTIGSYNRTQATHLAYSMADRMRANVAGRETYITLGATPENTAKKANCFTSTGCLPADMAENDLYEWNQALQDSNNGLAKTGKISYAAPVFTIAITWGESRDENKDKSADPDLTFTTDFQL